jgi:hypothetical protein
MAKWLNLTGQSIMIDLAGILTLSWRGGANGNVDLAVVHKHVLSDGSVVYVELLAKTWTGSDGTSQTENLSVRDLMVGPQDEIWVTARHTGSTGWITLNDDSLQLKLKTPTAYQNGFIQWNRGEDWTAGTNPDNDLRYNQSTWKYEYVAATNSEGLGTVTPWYKKSPQLLTWDSNFNPASGLTGEAWSDGDNQGPAIFANRLVDRGSSAGDRRPMVGWTNNTGTRVTVDVLGDLDLAFHNGATGTIQVAVVRRKTDGTYTTLYSTSQTAAATVRLDAQNTVLDPGDEILLAVLWNYGTDTASSHYVSVSDSMLFLRVNPYLWDRATDWTARADGDQGTTRGNPDDDALGFRTWQYASIGDGNSDGLASPIPWYTKATSPLVWCANWRDTGEKGWVYQPGDGSTGDLGPAIFNNRLLYSGQYGSRRPALEWLNPTGRSITLDVTGDLQVAWEGSSGTAAGDVEVALVRRNADGTTATPLWTATLQSSNGLTQDLPLDLSRVSLGAGDRLVLTMRWDYGSDTDPAHWVALYDGLKLKLADSIDIAESTLEDTPLTIAYLAGDSRFTSSTMYLEQAPLRGTAVVQANGSIVYTPATNSNGVDAFIYGVDCPGLGPISVEVTVNVTPANDIPVVAADTLRTSVGRPANIDVLANDSDADLDLLRVSLVGVPSHGRAIVQEDQSITYIPTSGYTGSDSFTYQVNDGTGTSATATVNVTVNSPLLFYVSPTGNDGNDGLTPATALATLEGARQKARPVVGQAVEVVFAAGTYRQTGPVNFDAEDSGTSDLPIVYRAADLYPQDWTWRRSADWTAGTTQNSSDGNPDNDLKGNPAWEYVYVSGGDDAGGANPWYLQTPQTRLVWDASWYGNSGRWAKGDNVVPTAGQNFMEVVGSSSPIAKWHNPTGRTVAVDLTGNVTLSWSSAASGNADLAIVHKRVSSDSIEYIPLVAQTLNGTGGTSQTVSVSVESLMVGPEDEIWITPRYAGTAGWVTLNDQPLTIRLLTPTPQTVTLSGSQVLVATWQAASEAPGAYKTNLTAFLAQYGLSAFNTLFVDGQRAIRAREPDVGYYTIAAVDPATNLTAFQFREGDLSASWGNLTDVEVLVLHLWEQTRERIASVDDTTNVVTFAAPLKAGRGYDCDYGGPAAGTSRYWVENFLEGLDTPGEWYLNRTTHDLYYRPQEGQSISSLQFTVPVTQQLLNLQNTSDVSFDGLSFVETDWQETDGYRGSQGSDGEMETLPAIHVNGGQGFGFTDNHVARVGGYALKVASGAAQLVGNELADLGAGGIVVPNTALTGHRISRNEVHDYGRLFHDAIGVITKQAGWTRVTNNRVHDGNYMGIQVGWSWTDAATAAHDNLVQENEIHHVMEEQYDGGGIYLNGFQPGTIVQANWIHDVVRTSNHLPDNHWHVGLYLDEGSSGILMRGNLVCDVTVGLLIHHPLKTTTQPGYRLPSVVESNIFVNPDAIGLAAHQYPKAILRANVVAWTEIPSGPVDLISSPTDRGVESYYPYRSDFNLFDTRLVTVNASTSLAAQRKRGKDLHSMVADPLFVDPANGDYRLRSESPALTLGFAAPWLVAGGGGFFGLNSIEAGQLLSAGMLAARDAALVGLSTSSRAGGSDDAKIKVRLDATHADDDWARLLAFSNSGWPRSPMIGKGADRAYPNKLQGSTAVSRLEPRAVDRIDLPSVVGSVGLAPMDTPWRKPGLFESGLGRKREIGLLGEGLLE